MTIDWPQDGQLISVPAPEASTASSCSHLGQLNMTSICGPLVCQARLQPRGFVGQGEAKSFWSDCHWTSSGLPKLRSWRIHFCMANVLTVRLPSSLLAKVDRKAASLGRRRAEHVRQVLEADVAHGEARPKRFALLSLKGRHG